MYKYKEIKEKWAKGRIELDALIAKVELLEKEENDYLSQEAQKLSVHTVGDKFYTNAGVLLTITEIIFRPNKDGDLEIYYRLNGYGALTEKEFLSEEAGGSFKKIAEDGVVLNKSNIIKGITLLGKRISLIKLPKSYALVELRHSTFDDSWEYTSLKYNTDGRLRICYKTKSKFNNKTYARYIHVNRLLGVYKTEEEAYVASYKCCMAEG